MTPSLANLGLDLKAETDAAFGAWFAAIAAQLLNGSDFLVAGKPHRIVEIEAYYYHRKLHPDPFTHRHPVQLEHGRWYFHRVGKSYRGGSFKGVDVTLGDGAATFGILIRSMVAPSGEIICGPSRTVDYLLLETGAASVAALDAMIGSRSAWEESSPLAIRAADSPRADTVLATPRVGLSLKRQRGSAAVSFLLRPYRFLTEPRRITKGKGHIVRALHRDGADRLAIRRITGAPLPAIDRYLQSFEASPCQADEP